MVFLARSSELFPEEEEEEEEEEGVEAVKGDQQRYTRTTPRITWYDYPEQLFLLFFFKEGGGDI